MSCFLNVNFVINQIRRLIAKMFLNFLVINLPKALGFLQSVYFFNMYCFVLENSDNFFHSGKGR